MPGVGYITKSCVWSYNASLHSYVSIISQKSKEVTTNFILISSYQQNNIWHIKKEVKSTTDILTFSMHYKSREFSSPDTSENQYVFDIALCIFCTEIFLCEGKTGLSLIILCAVLLSCMTQTQYWTQSVWYLIQSQWYLNQTNRDIWPNQSDI